MPIRYFRLWLPIVIMCFSMSLAGCYFFNKRSVDSESQDGKSQEVVESAAGETAGAGDDGLLDDIRASTTRHAPAGIRPDPDVFVRRLLLQYRAEGATVARQIGEVERYRLLLGGASEDFRVVPQEGYDATSLLADLTVASSICTGLVAPNSSQHPGWDSILPAPPDDFNTNLRFLAQRILGIPSQNISDEQFESLRQILFSKGSQLSYESYSPVCAALIIDADALFL